MVYGVILAGGVGSRMGNVDKPKQFLTIQEKPILVYTLEKFYANPSIEQVVVLCPAQWVGHTKNMVRRYLPDGGRVVVLEGGETRNETIMNAIRYIEEQGNLDEETIIVTHDAVRPFVTHRIIEENITAARKYGACDTVIAATDTIVESNNNECISDIPDRRKMYQGQTPQSFKALTLKQIYQSLSPQEKDVLTDACKILVIKGQEVRLVEGETFNIKITYPYDLRVAKSLLEDDEIC